MEVRSCRRCETPASPPARYCVECGLALHGDAAASADGGGGSPGPSEPVMVLVECEVCGAGNAASRPLCARCGTPLRAEIPGGDALPEPVGDQGTSRSPRGSDGPSLLLGLVLLAGLLTAGVLLALVMSRVTAPDDPVVPTGVEIIAATASSSLDDHPPSRAVDGDPQSAWVEAAPGPGEGEWIEVTLARETAVRRVVIWNGDQRDELRFTRNGRAAGIRIEVGDRQFRVVLRDITGPQAIDLPEPVQADRVRIVIEVAITGARYADLAISEIVVEGG